MSFNIAHEPLPLRELLVAEQGGNVRGTEYRLLGICMHAYVCTGACVHAVCICVH